MLGLSTLRKSSLTRRRLEGLGVQAHSQFSSLEAWLGDNSGCSSLCSGHVICPPIHHT